MANTSYIGVGPADRDPTVSDNSVTEGKIANDAVTNTKIADNAVDGAQIALTGNVQGNVMYYNGTDWVVFFIISSLSFFIGLNISFFPASVLLKYISLFIV